MMTFFKEKESMSKQALFEYVNKHHNSRGEEYEDDYDRVCDIADYMNIERPDILDTIDGSCLIILIKLIMKDND